MFNFSRWPGRNREKALLGMSYSVPNEPALQQIAHSNNSKRATPQIKVMAVTAQVGVAILTHLYSRI